MSARTGEGQTIYASVPHDAERLAAFRVNRSARTRGGRRWVSETSPPKFRSSLLVFTLSRVPPGRKINDLES
jgi:hypothetical protein